MSSHTDGPILTEWNKKIDIGSLSDRLSKPLSMFDRNKNVLMRHALMNQFILSMETVLFGSGLVDPTKTIPTGTDLSKRLASLTPYIVRDIFRVFVDSDQVFHYSEIVARKIRKLDSRPQKKQSTEKLLKLHPTPQNLLGETNFGLALGRGLFAYDDSAMAFILCLVSGYDSGGQQHKTMELVFGSGYSSFDSRLICMEKDRPLVYSIRLHDELYALAKGGCFTARDLIRTYTSLDTIFSYSLSRVFLTMVGVTQRETQEPQSPLYPQEPPERVKSLWRKTLDSVQESLQQAFDLKVNWDPSIYRKQTVGAFMEKSSLHREYWLDGFMGESKIEDDLIDIFALHCKHLGSNIDKSPQVELVRSNHLEAMMNLTKKYCTSAEHLIGVIKAPSMDDLAECLRLELLETKTNKKTNEKHMVRFEASRYPSLSLLLTDLKNNHAARTDLFRLLFPDSASGMGEITSADHYLDPLHSPYADEYRSVLLATGSTHDGSHYASDMSLPEKNIHNIHSVFKLILMDIISPLSRGNTKEELEILQDSINNSDSRGLLILRGWKEKAKIHRLRTKIGDKLEKMKRQADLALPNTKKNSGTNPSLWSREWRFQFMEALAIYEQSNALRRSILGKFGLAYYRQYSSDERPDIKASEYDYSVFSLATQPVIHTHNIERVLSAIGQREKIGKENLDSIQDMGQTAERLYNDMIVRVGEYLGKTLTATEGSYSELLDVVRFLITFQARETHSMFGSNDYTLTELFRQLTYDVPLIILTILVSSSNAPDFYKTDIDQTYSQKISYLEDNLSRNQARLKLSSSAIFGQEVEMGPLDDETQAERLNPLDNDGGVQTDSKNSISPSVLVDRQVLSLHESSERPNMEHTMHQEVIPLDSDRASEKYIPETLWSTWCGIIGSLYEKEKIDQHLGSKSVDGLFKYLEETEAAILLRYHLFKLVMIHNVDPLPLCRIRAQSSAVHLLHSRLIKNMYRREKMPAYESRLVDTTIVYNPHNSINKHSRQLRPDDAIRRSMNLVADSDDLIVTGYGHQHEFEDTLTDSIQWKSLYVCGNANGLYKLSTLRSVNPVIAPNMDIFHERPGSTMQQVIDEGSKQKAKSIESTKELAKNEFINPFRVRTSQNFLKVAQDLIETRRIQLSLSSSVKRRHKTVSGRNPTLEPPMAYKMDNAWFEFIARVDLYSTDTKPQKP